MKLIRKLGIQENVTLTGFIDNLEELKSWYKKADIFILPSKGEGFPRVLDEAAFFGLPIIATDVPEISSIFQNRRSAILVPIGNPQAIVEAINEITENDDIRDKIVKEAHKIISAKTKISAAEQHLKLILE